MTSIETRITSAGTFVFSTKFIKSVVSLRYESCDCSIGSTSLLTNDEMRSVGPSHPDMIHVGLPTRVGL